jgi:hypothetical protein
MVGMCALVSSVEEAIDAIARALTMHHAARLGRRAALNTIDRWPGKFRKYIAPDASPVSTVESRLAIPTAATNAASPADHTCETVAPAPQNESTPARRNSNKMCRKSALPRKGPDYATLKGK